MEALLGLYFFFLPSGGALLALHRWDGWFPWLKFKLVDFFFSFGAGAVVSGVALGLHSAPDFRIAPLFFWLRLPTPPGWPGILRLPCLF